MKPSDIAYEFGKQAGVHGILKTLSGRSTDQAITEQYKRIMSLPYVKQVAKQNPGDMSTFETYINKVLRGGEKLIPGYGDIPTNLRRAKGRQKLLKAMETGQMAVKGQKIKTLKARAGVAGAAALPAVGSAALSDDTKHASNNAIEEAAPSVAGAAVGASPILQGMRSGALGRPAPKKLRVRNVEKLQAMLQPGDMLLTSKPGVPSAFKVPITMLGGDPYGYHVESVVKNPKSGPTFIHSTPAEGGASQYKALLSEGEDAIVKRFKNPEHVQPYLKNLADLKRREDVVEKMLGPYARSKMYDMSSATKGSLKSFLPKSLHGFLSKGSVPGPGATVCSSLPGLASPVCLAPGVPRHETLPHHLQRSPELKTVGHYRVPRSAKMKGFEELLRAAPWLVRGALGAGLGYGAYKGVEKLLN